MDAAHLSTITDVQQLRDLVIAKMAEIAERDVRIATRDTGIVHFTASRRSRHIDPDEAH